MWVQYTNQWDRFLLMASEGVCKNSLIWSAVVRNWAHLKPGPYFFMFFTSNWLILTKSFGTGPLDRFISQPRHSCRGGRVWSFGATLDCQEFATEVEVVISCVWKNFRDISVKDRSSASQLIQGALYEDFSYYGHMWVDVLCVMYFHVNDCVYVSAL